MVEISIDSKFGKLNTPVALGIMKCSVFVKKSTKELKRLLDMTARNSAKSLDVKQLKELPAIKNTRDFYKLIGKDPSRYRPSPEMLLRRVVNGKSLYYINNAVDTMNAISIKSLFPLGLYDLEKIVGKITFKIGGKGMKYKGIRKEIVNVEDLPVLVDTIGPFGNPSSDSERTMVTEDTRKLLLIVFSFGEKNYDLITETLLESITLFKQFVGGSDFEMVTI